MAIPPKTLTCPQCSYVNEAERVYCHNCGSKLDRSLLPKEDDKQTQESITRSRNRVRKMTNPGGKAKQEIKTLFSTLAWAAAIAALILIAREPAGVPPASEDTIPRLISSEILDALESPQPRQMQFNEAEVNAYLRSSVKGKTKSGVPGIEFERAYVQFQPHACKVAMQQSLWGWPLHSGSIYRLEVKSGQFTATNVGGNFGRLAVHPLIMQYADVAFKPLWAALKRERGNMDKMQAVLVDKGRIVLVTKGAGR
jgi:hypothetical protein